MKSFRFVPEGRGGTFTWNPASDKPNEQTEYIGTDGTETCVSVYFPVDEDRCFFAHIFVVLRSIEGEASFATAPAKGFEIEQSTKTALVSESVDQSWKYSKGQMRKRLIMVCPHEYDVSGENKQTGYYVVKALHDFLGFPDGEELRAESDSRGFIASIRDGLVEYIAHDATKHSDVAPSTVSRWKEAEEPKGNMGAWSSGPRVGTWADVVEE